MDLGRKFISFFIGKFGNFNRVAGGLVDLGSWPKLWVTNISLKQVNFNVLCAYIFMQDLRQEHTRPI